MNIYRCRDFNLRIDLVINSQGQVLAKYPPSILAPPTNSSLSMFFSILTSNTIFQNSSHLKSVSRGGFNAVIVKTLLSEFQDVITPFHRKSNQPSFIGIIESIFAEFITGPFAGPAVKLTIIFLFPLPSVQDSASANGSVDQLLALWQSLTADSVMENK